MKKKKKNPHKSGLLAETVAYILLSFKLYRVIERRYKTPVGEIDLIAIRGNTLIFIEVKKRSTKREVFDAITEKQKLRIYRAAEIFMLKNPTYSRYKKRFDAILLTPKFLPIHIKNAW